MQLLWGQVATCPYGCIGKSNLFLFEIDIEIDIEINLAIEIDIEIDIAIDIAIENILEHIAWAFFYPFSRCPSTSFLLPLAEANGNKKGFPIAIGTPIGPEASG